MSKQITVIRPLKESTKRIRAAVYARVSVKSERLCDSLENQIKHYRETIGADPRYKLIEIYYDYGISGFKSSRPGFQRGIALRTYCKGHAI